MLRSTDRRVSKHAGFFNGLLVLAADAGFN